MILRLDVGLVLGALQAHAADAVLAVLACLLG